MLSLAILTSPNHPNFNAIWEIGSTHSRPFDLRFPASGLRNVLHHMRSIKEMPTWKHICMTAPMAGAKCVAEDKQCHYYNHCWENILEQFTYNAHTICTKILREVNVQNAIRMQWTKFWQISVSPLPSELSAGKGVGCHGRYNTVHRDPSDLRIITTRGSFQ